MSQLAKMEDLSEKYYSQKKANTHNEDRELLIILIYRVELENKSLASQ
jgi:hypothetical protein